MRGSEDPKVLAAIITYYPEFNLLKKNIDSIRNDVDMIIIWENTPENDKYSYRYYDNTDKILYKGAGNNVGISKALNVILDYSFQNGYNYIVIMDQDSYWINFPLYKTSVIKKNSEEKCLIGPITQTHNIMIKENEGIKECRWLINSGMMAPVNLLKELGGFNEHFFVDGVDIELCLYAKRKGFNCYHNYEGRLVHRVGKQIDVVFGGRKRQIIYYNSKRILEILRNHIILYRLFGVNDLYYITKGYTKNFVLSLIIKGDRYGRLMAIFKGLYNGVTANLRVYRR